MINGLIKQDGKFYFLSTKTYFAERTRKIKEKNCREWDPLRSKLAAALVKGVKSVEINKETEILYLGAAHGYTPSFMSQAARKVFAIEFAPRVARELVMLASNRRNVLPILADANDPASYFHLLGPVDVVYQDIAQRNQAEIFAKNCRMFLKKKGTAMIAVKAKSIDATAKTSKTVSEVKKRLEQDFRIIDYRNLEPFQKDHAFFVCSLR